MEHYDLNALMSGVGIENVNTLEFELGDYSLVWNGENWEIQFEDSEGFQAIKVEEESFYNEKLEFSIDEKDYCLDKNVFDSIQNFCNEKQLIK